MAGEIIAGVVNRLLNDSATSFHMREKDELARAQWERQNSYDHPRAVMSRFRAAGLNPDLIYNQQSAGQGITYPETDPIYDSSIPNAFQNAAVNSRQDALADSQIELNESVASLNHAKAGEADAHASYYKRLEMAQDVLDGLRESQNDLNQQRIAESLKNIDLVVAKIRETEENVGWINSRRVAQYIENSHLDEKILAQIGLLKAQKAQSYASAEESREHAAVYREQAAQLAEITKTFATRVQSEMQILVNDAAMSDKQKQSVELEMYKKAYDLLKYKGWVYQDAEGYHFTSSGAKVAAGESVINFVDRLLGAVGNFYTHHSFYNASPQTPREPKEPKKYPVETKRNNYDAKGNFIGGSLQQTLYE